jgi:NADH-quinone oxidoreductase subunit J
MAVFDTIFYLFAIITVASACVTVFAKNITYAAFSLVFTFFGVAGVYVLLSADFLAITQLMVYVGGILILLIFGVMLTNRITNVDIRIGNASRLPVAIISAGLFAALSIVITGTKWMTFKGSAWAGSAWTKNAVASVLTSNYNTLPAGTGVQESSGTSAEIGKLMLTDYLLPFEIVSIVLLIALVGAAMIARKEPTPDHVGDTIRIKPEGLI